MLAILNATTRESRDRRRDNVSKRFFGCIFAKLLVFTNIITILRMSILVCVLGWFKKPQFRGNQLFFHLLNLYVEKNSREGCGLYDDI